jgi:ankyrin repeat protein
VVAYLLRVGVNPNFKDVSENTALHYACAYGWKNIVKLLVEEGGADPNTLNEWKTSSILIAMLKGHFGIVDYLINLKQLNASFMDD